MKGSKDPQAGKATIDRKSRRRKKRDMDIAEQNWKTQPTSAEDGVAKGVKP